MSMTIQSGVKDEILDTLSETPKYEYEICYHLGKADVVTNALSRKERMKPRHVRAMAMTIHYGVRGMILAAQSEAFKQENVPLVRSEIDEAHALSYLVHPEADKKYYNLGDIKDWSSGVDHLRLRWEIYFMVLADAAERIRNTTR
ncbi:hypothetical protein Tco_0881910 [Tanacetum coccineum]